MSTDTRSPGSDEYPQQPWIHLTEPHEVEAWINQCNQDLQQLDKNQARLWRVCFSLALGGDIYMHSTDDAVMLDVTREAQWAEPVIAAATTVSAPRGQIWVLPADKLIQLLMGLSSLITSTQIVPNRSNKRLSL